jgi:uncharacterized linocin/CFP29 family protein
MTRVVYIKNATKKAAPAARTVMAPGMRVSAALEGSLNAGDELGDAEDAGDELGVSANTNSARTGSWSEVDPLVDANEFTLTWSKLDNWSRSARVATKWSRLWHMPSNW